MEPRKLRVGQAISPEEFEELSDEQLARLVPKAYREYFPGKDFCADGHFYLHDGSAWSFFKGDFLDGWLGPSLLYLSRLRSMNTAGKKTVLRVILLGLVAGGICGGAVGFGYAPPLVGVGGAVLVGVMVGLLVARARKDSVAE
jgi:hypothetical protein